jgi:hypothetical protein
MGIGYECIDNSSWIHIYGTSNDIKVPYLKTIFLFEHSQYCETAETLDLSIYDTNFALITTPVKHLIFDFWRLRQNILHNLKVPEILSESVHLLEVKNVY